MTTKNEVSSSYLETLMNEHGEKPRDTARIVLITGAGKPNSIGSTIARRIEEGKTEIDFWMDDIRYVELPLMSGYDTLIMCHGVCHLDWFENAPMEIVQEIFDVNVVGTYRMASKFVRDTIHTDDRKQIVIIGSMAHKAVLNGSAAYCASKAALAHLVRCMAWELAPKGFDVYIIHPSNVEGAPMSEETIKGLMRYRDMSRKQAESYWNDSPIRSQSLTMSEIAELVHFIVTKNPVWLSGTQLDLGGGQR